MEFFQDPCVLLKYSPITSQHHQHVEASNTNDGKKERSFWKWPSFRFPRRKTGKYDLVQAEKNNQCEPGVFRRVEPEEKHEVKQKKEKRSVWKWLTQRKGKNSLDQTEEKLNKAPEVPRPAVEECQILQKYKIGPRLGEGGFGFVHAGIRRDGLKVAVKFSVKSPNMLKIKVPGHQNPLPAEIGLTLMANTGPSVPQIIRLLDWEDHADYFTMVLERPEPCTDMFSFLKLRGGSLDEKTARDILQQVVRAAIVSCERGVFHRDIKLENLLLNPDTMEVKLIDFGCGALMKKTAFTVFAGTREYFPPEFSQDGRYHAKPTTVWGLGILLFIMVCGAFPSACDLQMSFAKTWSSPGLSRECCQMICDCLQPNPEERLTLEEMPLHDWFMVME